MTTKFIYIELIIFIILLSLEWKHSNIKRTKCSKDKSRLVRKIILSKWNPILDKYNAKFPLECPFNYLRDYFLPGELSKNRNRPSQWTCKLCGKSFFKEKHIDEHMERRHYHLKNWAEDATCLANYCDIMRCDVFETKESLIKVEKNEIITDIEVWEDISFQKALIPSTTDTNAKSAPIDTKKSFSMNTEHASRIPTTTELPYHTRKLCLATSTTSNINQNQNLDNKGNINYKNAQKSSMSEEKSTPSPKLTNSNNNTNENMTMQQKIRNNCKSDELEKLKLKCQSLVRSCTIGLLLQMSDFSYKAMEDELNNAVCWYLTCDRYWEDGPMSVQSLPWILIIIVIIIFSLGICFCYYIIWILFDLDEKDNFNHLKSSTNNYNEIYSQRKIDNQFLDSRSYTDPRDLANNDNYIYVTYPDLKKRLLETKY